MKADIKKIIPNIVPILIMIGLIPFFTNDYYLLLSYTILIVVFLKVHYEKNEYRLLLAGIIFMFIAEYIFISTGVEIFTSKTLVNMPIWLPILWGYGFIAMRRVAYELLK